MTNKEISANPEDTTIKTFATFFRKNKAGKNKAGKNKAGKNKAGKNKAEHVRTLCLILMNCLILVMIGLMVTFIVVWIRHTSCPWNNEVGEHRSITRAPEIAECESEKSAPCEDYWIWYLGKCYYFSTQRDTWRNSEKFCNSHNSSLAIIESKEELDFLYRHKDLDHHWIGMRRTDDNTAWTWTDGSSYNESLFKIKRTSKENIEHVYLNSGNVGSDGGNFNYNWICNKK
ncbi:natural killer cells antigen CD94-like isoform X2 [Ranitomeya imitator]|uniref:natural killer cells antigen CD94-like isoform X2 n=1 Tax=Ranitomeya imitator TaxID=111125 RepID=UPI0037E94445